MKKLLALLAIVVSTSCYAALQYTIVNSPNPNSQPWEPAQYITLKVTQSGSLWFSSYVSNGWGDLPDLNSLANMSAGNYGAVNTATGAVTLGNGVSQDIVYTNGTNWDGTPHTFTTPAYYVGDFNAGDEVSFWITNRTSGAIGDSVGPVSTASGQLQSRQDYQTDYFGQTRINFGFSGLGSIEFVAIGGEGTMGQPLPGVVAALALGSMAVGGIAAFRRRRSGIVG